ncbi:MAG: MBL fold metallo-hydrolase [Actinomycetota bacterium]|nr:MBL fold metallo-hydrolase [Rubrobacteraceae bacterium]MBA3636479.1 MBL fold metallo-hydrolase [Rubrobacteraceae bacterium]MBA3702002.1 MBL fold metallo-hydrolase [Rubrobacteraceae bacterium]MDQ3184327.1 MBL fold metallo-hydrolase [Actinomycetota bacterium]MDQ3498575.1 MBL fold metallo-hydrolase [Actinomycetota bacterium]
MSEIEQVTLSMGGFEVNSYVVHAPDGDIVVDAGAEPEKILGATRAPVAAILVTHGHADHVEALEFVRSETGAPVYMHPADAGGKVNDYRALEDGRALDVAGLGIRVFHTPGHSPGSVTFVVGHDQIVGDLILPGSVGRTDIAGASWEEIEASIRKVMPLWEEATRLYTGHGPVLMAVEELRTNPYLPPGLS